MNKLLLVFSILSNLFVASLASARFYTPQNLPKAPENFERAYSSALKINYDFDNWCSSAVVSNDGYVLTNLHCLRSCFELTEGLFEDYVETYQGNSYNGWRMKIRSGNGMVCKDYFSFGNDDVEADPELIWVGKGRAAFDDEKIAEIPQAIFNLIKNESDDFAILKFKVTTEGLSCLPLSPKEANAGDEVWSVGFPAKTQRNDNYDSDGKSRLISMGIVRENIQADPFLKTVYSKDIQWEKESEIFNQSKFLLTSLDSMNASSGSLIVNNKSELVGVLFGKIGVSQNTDTGGTAIGIRSSHIYRQVARGLGKEKAQEIFNCRK